MRSAANLPQKNHSMQNAALWHNIDEEGSNVAPHRCRRQQRDPNAMHDVHTLEYERPAMIWGPNCNVLP